MDKKIWFTGGEPDINIDDLGRNINANLDAILATLFEWLAGNNQNFIISGCELTITPGVEASVTAGYIFLNGEILQVDPQTVAFGVLDVYYYEKLTTYDPAGDKVYNNGMARQTWQVNRGKLTNSNIDPVNPTELDARGNTYAGKILEKIRGVYHESNAMSVTPDPKTNYFKLGISGAGSWVVTIPAADDPTVTADVNFVHVFDHAPGTGFGTYEFRDTNGLLIATSVHPEFGIQVNDNGVWRNLVTIPLVGNMPPVVLPLGAWDMQGTPIKIIPHGQLSKEAIAAATARIINDPQDTFFDFSGSAGGWISWDDTNVYLERTGTGSGRFNTTEFNDGVIDRGNVYLRLA